jgi:predicted peptidase
MMRKEFSIDENRTYLMGHSMGGAGTLFLGSKHAREWAAIAPIASAAFSMQNDRAKYLKDIKDAALPVIFVHGDMDEVVSVSITRGWVETAKEMKMDFEYVEVPGAGHGPIIEAGMPDIFKYFGAHIKGAKK